MLAVLTKVAVRTAALAQQVPHSTVVTAVSQQLLTDKLVVQAVQVAALMAAKAMTQRLVQAVAVAVVSTAVAAARIRPAHRAAVQVALVAQT